MAQEIPRDWKALLATSWRTAGSGPFFEFSDPPGPFLDALPSDYKAVAAEFGGREGFLGQTYLRLYRLNELVALNVAYHVPKLLPKLIVFGSNGCGEAFGFALGAPAVIQVPFLPLCAEQAGRHSESFGEFIADLASTGESSPFNPAAVGMEVHDKHPICLGGSPTDPANKVLVPVVKHAEICNFWNDVYRHALAKHRGAANQ
jgi:hypothetical protein